MSGGTIKSGNLQVGQDGTASNNFTWYQPAVADGTVRLGQGVAGATTKDMVTVSGSTITLGGNLVQASTAAPAFSAYQSSSQTISNAAWTKITLTSEDFDTNSNYDTSTSKFTPTVAGYYQVNAAITLNYTAATNKPLLIELYKNGGEYKLGGSASSTSLVFPRTNLNALVYLNGTTDYIELYGYQNTGSSQVFAFDTYSTYFQAFLARSA